jgi:DNA polymerase-3 subunit gamma/tau
VLSRCQRFDLKRIGIEALIEHLAAVAEKEGASADRAALALIARASEGSVRDALSILDRAIAFGGGQVETDAVRGLLGLADRTRIFDLLETVLAGDTGAALNQLAALTQDGAEPGQVVADLADAVHSVTLVKAAGADSADPAASEAERARAASLAQKLTMPVLARAWQMLLKGYDEVRASPRPLAAADMVLVRLAYAADLPPPEELARRLRDGQDTDRGEGDRGPRVSAVPPRKPAHAEAPSSRQPEEAVEEARLESFDDVVALAEAKRDLKLKHALMEQVRLVHFKPGMIELNPLPTAPRDLAQELARKLKAWTGRMWGVAVSDEEGAEPLGLQRRAREAREIETVRAHPAVQEVLQHFPGARIATVRPTPPPAEAPDEDDEADPLTEDGTN